MALQEEVCLWVWECVSESEQETEKCRREGALGSNESGLHWKGESWRILCGKTGVHSLPGQRLWSGTSVISYKTHTHMLSWNYLETKPVSSSCTSLPCHNPPLHIWFRLDVKDCCDQTKRANGSMSHFCKQPTIDYFTAYCVSLFYKNKIKNKIKKKKQDWHLKQRDPENINIAIIQRLDLWGKKVL